MNSKALSPYALKPMLVTPAKQAPVGELWVHEINYDGFRMLCHVAGGAPAFVSRHGKDWTSSIPGVARCIQELALKDAVLDGELVYFAEDGRTDFDEFRKRLGRKTANLSYVADLVAS